MKSIYLWEEFQLYPWSAVMFHTGSGYYLIVSTAYRRCSQWNLMAHTSVQSDGYDFKGSTLLQWSPFILQGFKLHGVSIRL